MMILSITTLIEAVMTEKVALFTLNTVSKVTVVLYQLSSVFEAGVSLACVVTLHNWFSEKVLGIVSSIWFSAIYA
jgi:sugar phosphate permease